MAHGTWDPFWQPMRRNLHPNTICPTSRALVQIRPLAHPCRNLEYFISEKTRITGTIPAAWRLPKRLFALFLCQSSIGGSIPARWRLPKGLNMLVLRDNKLRGRIPAGWRLPGSLESLNLRNNLLTGSIPPAWLPPPSLLLLELDGNKLSGRAAAGQVGILLHVARPALMPSTWWCSVPLAHRSERLGAAHPSAVGVQALSCTQRKSPPPLPVPPAGPLPRWRDRLLSCYVSYSAIYTPSLCGTVSREGRAGLH